MRGILLLIAVLWAQGTTAQGHHAAAYHVDEVGFGVAPVFNMTEEEEPGTALHAHYIHHLGRTTLGLGADVEYVLADHEHTSFMALIQWSPHPYTHLVLAPGLFHATHGPWDPAVHLEAYQDFHWHGMAIGPFMEWAFEPGQQQMELGVHLGVPLGGKEVLPQRRHGHHHHGHTVD